MRYELVLKCQLKLLSILVGNARVTGNTCLSSKSMNRMKSCLKITLKMPFILLMVYTLRSCSTMRPLAFMPIEYNTLGVTRL